MAKIKIKHFSSTAETHKWLVENQDSLKAQRRSEPKKTDAFAFTSFAINDKGERLSAAKDDSGNAEMEADNDTLKVRCIINTTNFIDSHSDVHFPGIWKKSLQECKSFTLCNQHDFSFGGTITDDVNAYTKNYTWKELGFKYEGETEALVFDCTIKREDIAPENQYMFDFYQKGKVKNHSVRMQYVKEYFCLNSEEPFATQYKENWDKWIDQVANKDEAITRGYFYAVTEAKIIEGSAVKRGSNCATPTIELSDDDEEAENDQAGKNEPLDKNKNEPDASTQKSYYSSLIY